MNIASDPKSIPPGTLLSPEANQAAALASATGVLTVDLDAIVANWRKLEKTAVPAECAGVVKADAYGCGAEQVARALAAAGCKTFFVATLDEARVVRAAAPGGHDLCARWLLPEHRRGLRQDRLQAGDRRPQRARRMGRVLPPLRLVRRRGHSHRYRHEPARTDGHRGAGHHPADQCRRSRHHAGDEPPRLRRTAQQSRQRQAAHGLSRDRQPVHRRAGVAGEFVRHFLGRRNSSSTWCGRAARFTASIRRRKPTIRCSRSSN